MISEARDDSTLDKLTDSDKNSDDNSEAGIDSNAWEDKNKDVRRPDDHSNKYDAIVDDFKDSEILYDVLIDDIGRDLNEDLKATKENSLLDSDVLDGVEAGDNILLSEEFVWNSEDDSNNCFSTDD